MPSLYHPILFQEILPVNDNSEGCVFKFNHVTYSLDKVFENSAIPMLDILFDYEMRIGHSYTSR